MFRSVVLLTTALLCLTSALVTRHNNTKWSYLGLEGPSEWPAKFHHCNETSQSPIDIQTDDTVYNPELQEPVFYHPNHSDPKNHTGHEKYYLTNNGHTVMMTFDGDFYVNKSGLEGTYKTAQLHFHWGSVNSMGSEHKINGKAFPLEMHIVNYDQSFDTVGDAAKQSEHGLAVFGVMFEIGEKDNPLLVPFIDTLHKIHLPKHEHEEQVDVFVLRDLLPVDMSRYYRYQGSLTTPMCYESVVWTLFEQKVTLSELQLSAFRGLLTHAHADVENSHIYNIPLVNNYRHTQQLNGRKVYRSFQKMPTYRVIEPTNKANKADIGESREAGKDNGAMTNSGIVSTILGMVLVSLVVNI